MSHIHEVSDANFERDVLEASHPVLVDFWAQWCAPCKALVPILEDVAHKYAGKVKVLKMEIDLNPQTPPKFGIRSIPALILFKDGQVVASHAGLLSKAELTSFIDNHC